MPEWRGRGWGRVYLSYQITMTGARKTCRTLPLQRRHSMLSLATGTPSFQAQVLWAADRSRDRSVKLADRTIGEQNWHRRRDAALPSIPPSLDGRCRRRTTQGRACVPTNRRRPNSYRSGRQGRDCRPNNTWEPRPCEPRATCWRHRRSCWDVHQCDAAVTVNAAAVAGPPRMLYWPDHCQYHQSGC